MTITEKDYPVLLKLKTKDLGKSDLYSSDADAAGMVKDFAKTWAGVSLGINNQIYYLSPEFAAAYERAGDDVFNSYPYKWIDEDNICFLHANKMATCMNIRHNKVNKIITCAVFCFNGDIITTVGKYEIGYADESNLLRLFTGWKSGNISNVEPNLFNCILMTLFIKTPDVSRVKVPAGSTIASHKNTSFMPVVMLSSK